VVRAAVTLGPQGEEPRLRPLVSHRLGPG